MKVRLLALILCFLCVSESGTHTETDNQPDSFKAIQDIQTQIDDLTVTFTALELIDDYTVFITAYCAEECGWNYETSSGATCHRSSEENRINEPSTCAVDLRYFGYSTLFYIPSEDRIYIAEDTGAFRGLWLDLYEESLSDVIYFPTRYETVYTCEFVTRQIRSGDYNIHKYIREVFINDIRTGIKGD